MMKHVWFIGCCIVVLFMPAYAQKPAPMTAGEASRKTTETSAREEVDPLVAERRQVAISLLTSLAIEARSYRDQTLRARVAARVADALWKQDSEGARALFRRAWEAAEAVEAQSVPNNGAVVPGRLSKNQSLRPLRPPTNLREEILKLALKHDRALGEEFLKKLTAAKNDDAARTTDPTSKAPAISQAEIAERLKLAGQFLESDDVERALQFADPALVQINMGSIQFLVRLRDKNPASADQRFTALLSGATADPASDANTVSLLTSYAFTPSTYLVVTASGIPSRMNYPPRPAPELAPGLRSLYFHVAAEILLRPVAALDQSSAGRAGTSYVATRLFPLFQQYAPDLAPLISAQLAALGNNSSVQGVTWNDLDNGDVSDGSGKDAIQRELENRLSRARTADQRDLAYAMSALRAADAGDARAREFAEKIEDTETRKGIRRFVDYRLIRGLLEKKEVDAAVVLARKSDLTHTERTAVLTQAAAIISKTDQQRAIDLLGESLSETRRIDAATPDRAYALVGLLAQFSRIDRVRAWELMDETVKAVNAVSGFSGEDGRAESTLEGKVSIRMGTELASGTDLAESFAALSQDDIYQSINGAKTFSGEAPRALVILAIARSVLDQ